MKTNTNIKSVDRALLILLTIAEFDRPIGVSELNRILKIPKAPISKILKTLEERDFVRQDEDTELFALGTAIWQLSEKMNWNDSLIKVVEPFARELAYQSKELACLGVIQRDKVLILLSIQGRTASRFNIQLGPISDFHCSSLGKALLIDKSAEEVTLIVGEGPYQQYTANTITTLQGLVKEVEEVRKTGISFDKEETEEGLFSIGAPIRDWNDNVFAAISISALKARITDEKFLKFKNLVMQTAEEISQDLKVKVKDQLVTNLLLESKTTTMSDQKLQHDSNHLD